MSPHDPDLNATDARLARALRALPVADPPADGWERVRARLAARAAAERRRPALALAACVGLLAFGLWLRAGDDAAPIVADRSAPPPFAVPGHEPPPAAPSRTEPTRAVADWRRRSVELETLLAGIPEPRLTRGSTGLTVALLEDRIAAIDARLSEVAAADGATEAHGGRGPNAATPLWRERALLLDSLVQVRYAAAVDPAT